MTQEKYEQLKNFDTRDLYFALRKRLSGKINSENLLITAISICFNVYCVRSGDVCGDIDIDGVILNCDEAILYVKENFETDVLLAFILFNKDFEYDRREAASITPTSIIRLTNSLLDICSSDEFIELCSGNGSFFTENAFCLDNYTGVEINPDSYVISKIRHYLLGSQNNLILENALTFIPEKKANKAFGNFPFGLREGNNQYKEKLLERITIPTDVNATSDWLFCAALLSCLNENGKAVAVVTNGTSMNLQGKMLRQSFLEKGYIETVIRLPRNLFYHTPLPVNIIVLSFGNECVNLIDASELCVTGRKINDFLNDHIEKIVSLIGAKTEISTVKSCSEIIENDCVISPIRYLTAPIIENAIELGPYIKNVRRGTSMNAEELSSLRSETKTLYRYINVSNIVNGNIDYETRAEWLKEIPSKYEKYCVKNNTLVVSKIGSPVFKSAIVRKDEDIILLAGSNLFLIEFDEDKINPFYVQAFLASEKGIKTLQSISAGTSFLTFSVENLKRMLIPQATREEQDIIAKFYTDSLDELILLEQKKNIAIDGIKNLFNERVRGNLRLKNNQF